MSRTPDYDVKAMNKDTDEKRRIGAGWKNGDGSITIVLDAFTTLQSAPALIITLFPRTPTGATLKPPGSR